MSVGFGGVAGGSDWGSSACDGLSCGDDVGGVCGRGSREAQDPGSSSGQKRACPGRGRGPGCATCRRLSIACLRRPCS